MDVEQCLRCGKRETRIIFVTANDEIDPTLRSIGYPNAPDEETQTAA